MSNFILYDTVLRLYFPVSCPGENRCLAVKRVENIPDNFHEANCEPGAGLNLFEYAVVQHLSHQK